MPDTNEQTLPTTGQAAGSPRSASTLATVYFDNQRVSLMGDPKPVVAKILVAAGRPSGSVQVLRGQAADDRRGTPLAPTDVVDRTEAPTKAIWLTSAPKTDAKAQAGTDAEQAAPAFAVVDTLMPAPRGPLAPDAEQDEEGGPGLPGPVQPSRDGPVPPAR